MNYIRPEDYWPANDYGLMFVQVDRRPGYISIDYRGDGWLINDWIYNRKHQSGVYDWAVKLAVI